MTWYLRSIGDHDTHCGALRPADGTVAALCGVTFVPRPLPFGRGLGFPATRPTPSKYARHAPRPPGEQPGALIPTSPSCSRSRPRTPNGERTDDAAIAWATSTSGR